MNTLDEEKHMDRLCGFIFLCNGKTKPECYMYRVFGLPDFKKHVVENIKPGMKLFLFDFELKLLYGVYEATSFGRKNMEPTAFDGKFPAQVSFRIFEDCLPLPESSFRHAIKDSYQKGKFKQELNDQEVRSLLSLFRPLAQPTSVPVIPSLPIASRQVTLPPPAIDNLRQARETFLSQNDPFVAMVQVSDNLPVELPQHAPWRVEGQQYAYYGSAANFNPSVNKQTLPAPTISYLENPYAARMPYVHATQVLGTNCVEQISFSSQPASNETMVNIGYVHHAMELQTRQVPAALYHYEDTQTMVDTGYVHHATGPKTLQVPASSYHSADTQQAYVAGNPHYRYGQGTELSYSNQHPDSVNLHHISLERNQDIVFRPENAVHNYSSQWPIQNVVQNHAPYFPTTKNVV